MSRSVYEGGRFYPGTYADNDHMGDWSVHLGTNATLVDAGLAGGALQGSIVTTDDSVLMLAGPLMGEVDAGIPLMFEVDFRVTVDADTEAAFFIGWSDANAAGEIPIDDDGGTLVTTATDAVGLMMERAQDATWQAVSVDTDVDGAQTALTGASDLVLSTWQRLRIIVGGSGDTDFYIGDYDSNNNFLGWANNGNSLHTRSAAITTSVALCPVIAQQAHGASSAVTFQVRNALFRGPGTEITG